MTSVPGCKWSRIKSGKRSTGTQSFIGSCFRFLSSCVLLSDIQSSDVQETFGKSVSTK